MRKHKLAPGVTAVASAITFLLKYLNDSDLSKSRAAVEATGYGLLTAIIIFAAMAIVSLFRTPPRMEKAIADQLKSLQNAMDNANSDQRRLDEVKAAIHAHIELLPKEFNIDTAAAWVIGAKHLVSRLPIRNINFNVQVPQRSNDSEETDTRANMIVLSKAASELRSLATSVSLRNMRRQ